MRQAVLGILFDRRCKGKTDFKMESGLAELEKSGDARLFYVSNFGGHTGRIRGGRMKLAVLTMRRFDTIWQFGT